MQLLLSIQAGNKIDINNCIEKYKDGATIKFDGLLSIPFKDRLPGLIKEYGDVTIHGLLIIMLTDFCNFYNVIRPMSANQIVSCAYEIMNTSTEDFLSIEDLQIFFQGAKNSKYGKVYDRLDQQLIFEMLENYRQQRHETYMRIKDEKDSNYKSLGSTMRTSEDTKAIKDLFHEANLEYFKSKNATKNETS